MNPIPLFRTLSLLFATLLLSGCASLHYYMQAANGESAVLNKARPLDDVITDPATKPALADRLKLAQRIRAFAVSDLKLPDNASYTRYADLGRPYVLWNVVSTPALSLRPVESCFPIAGCLAYRGYYDEKEARDYADARRTAGDDVFLYGIPAYSTLGWFNDPLLNTTVRYGELALARLIFHELSHQLIYVKNDSSFNEAFATAVEQEGLLRWIEHEHRPDLLARYQADEARQQAFHVLMSATRKRLVTIYGSTVSDADKLADKEAILRDTLAQYQGLKAGWGGFDGYDSWFSPLPNNAHFASLATYEALVPAFRELLAQQHGDFAAFYDAVRELGKKNRAARDASLAALNIAALSGENQHETAGVSPMPN